MIAYCIQTASDDNDILLVTFPEVTIFGPNDTERLTSIALKGIEEAIAARNARRGVMP